MKECSRCGRPTPDFFFGLNHARYASLAKRRAICLGCEQDARDSAKIIKRERIKVRDTLRRHAVKFIKLGKADSRVDFSDKFGWNIDDMTHDLEHAYENGCTYCRRLFKTMGHGLSDITLDITDPRQDPFYSTNTRWICSTCNREKSRTPPDLWAAKLIEWAKYEAWKIAHKNRRYLGPLFSWPERAQI